MFQFDDIFGIRCCRLRCTKAKRPRQFSTKHFFDAFGDFVFLVFSVDGRRRNTMHIPAIACCPHRFVISHNNLLLIDSMPQNGLTKKWIWMKSENSIARTTRTGNWVISIVIFDGRTTSSARLPPSLYGKRMHVSRGDSCKSAGDYETKTESILPKNHINMSFKCR